MDSPMTWYAAKDRNEYKDQFLEAIDAVADAAYDARWADMFTALDAGTWGHPNIWRIGGVAGFSPLHQAAWHGAPRSVVEDLIGRAAWRTLRTSDGDRAVDIARERGHDHLVELLEPEPVQATVAHRAVDGHLMGLIESRIRPALTVKLRYPQTEVVHETGEVLSCPIPGMYGGFSITPTATGVEVSSSIRVVGGSGRRHAIDADECRLIEKFD